MKTAIVHDWLINDAGAEKALEAIYSLYPSPIYTLFHNKKRFSYPEVHTSFLQNFPFSQKIYRNLLPFYPLAIEQFDLTSYDLIISSSHAVAKGVLSHPQQKHICYCYTPMRYAWDLYFSYLREAKLHRGLKAKIVKRSLHYMRNWDLLSSNRVDEFVAISHYIARRIQKCYRRQAHVIYPPVRTNFFKLDSSVSKETFYLTCGRFVPYKKMHTIVEAFQYLPKQRLVVIGDGPERKKIEKVAGKNVELLGRQDDEQMKKAMQRAQAFLFMAEEDFGIVPIEAQACGTPVIAFGKGGALETVIENKTGIFFDKQTPQALAKAIQLFETKKDRFNPYEIRKHAESFSLERFHKEFNHFIQQALERE